MCYNVRQEIKVIFKKEFGRLPVQRGLVVFFIGLKGGECAVDSIKSAFEQGISAGEGYGAALAIISVLKAAGEEKLGESTTAKSFLDGFEKGKKQSALMVIAPLFSLFDITDEEKIIKASSFLGCSTEEIEKALAEAGQ